MVSSCSAIFEKGAKNNMKPRQQQLCLFGRLRITCAIKLLIVVGLLSIFGLLALTILYFRKALFVLSIPTLVCASTAIGFIRRDHRLIWPIVGISFFHMFLDAYTTLIFSFFFLFKPLYIIMVLNWAFDTMYTTKTPSYYATCFGLYIFFIAFFLFNFWQLKMSLRFQNYICESSTAVSSSSSGSSLSENSCRPQELKRIATPPPLRSAHSACKVLNEAPMVSINKVLKSGTFDSNFDRSIRSSAKNRLKA